MNTFVELLFIGTMVLGRLVTWAFVVFLLRDARREWKGKP